METEFTWEELREYSVAYTKAAVQLSMPLGKDRLSAFVKELWPQEFFPEDIISNLIAANSNILPFDFLGMLKALSVVTKSIRVTPRSTSGVRKIKLSEVLHIAKAFIDQDQDKDGLVQSSTFFSSNVHMDVSKLANLVTFTDIVKFIASSYIIFDHRSFQMRHSDPGSGIGQHPHPQNPFASYPQAPQAPPPQNPPQTFSPQHPQTFSPQPYQQQPQQQFQPYSYPQNNNPFISPPPQHHQPPQQQYYQQPQQQQSPYYPPSPQQPPQQQQSPHMHAFNPQQQYTPQQHTPQPQYNQYSPTALPYGQQPQQQQQQQQQQQHPSGITARPHPYPASPVVNPGYAQQPSPPPQQPSPGSPPNNGPQLDTVTLLKLFNLADVDKSGMLTADELVPIVRGVVRPGIPVTAQHSQMLMKMLDKDQNGSITIDEFLDGAKKFNWNPEVLSDMIASASRPISNSSGGDVTSDIEVPYKEIIFGERIGEGTFGLVYKAVWRGSPVAVKMLKMQNITDHALQEFRKELQILARLRHPNIVLLMGASTIPPNLTFVTEFLAGGSLFDQLQAKKITIDQFAFKRMAREIAQGMNYLHLSGIIHRDLKSLNILLDHNNTVKICDFGLSKIRSSEADVMTKKIGTPIWMAPELIRDENYDEKVDVYAYGIILWELGTGELPYPKMDSIQIAVAVSSKGLRPPIPDKWPQFLRDLAQQCWHDDPKVRPTFHQILEKLNQWQ